MMASAMALQSSGSRWWCAEAGGALVANRHAADVWEAFEVVQLDGGCVALRSAPHGTFISARAAPEARMDAAAATAGPHERFLMVDVETALGSLWLTNPDEPRALPPPPERWRSW